jgi:polysaccharide transporter, PST family
MTLIKTSILSAIATVIRIINGIIVTKVIAVYVGPSGLALLGQLQNFISIVLLFAGDLFRTATTKYTAQYSDDEKKKYGMWSTQIKILILFNIILSSLLFYFSDNISDYLLGDTTYSFVLKVLSCSIPFFVLNTMILSILNGHKQIKKFILLNITLSFVSLFIVVLLSINFGLKGALLAYVTNQSIVFFITLYVVRNEAWFKIKNFTHKLEKDNLKKLFKFALMAISAILASNLSLLFIRDYITQNISLQDAGYWQGVWSLTQISLTLVTTALATYFLPTLSSLKIKSEISNELKNAIKIILPIAIFISITMYLLRDFIIYILYTKEFLPMEGLFFWQLVGNVFKVAGWLFGYVLVAKAMVKYTVILEIVFSGTFILLSFSFIKEFGVVGATYAFAINSFLFSITVFLLYKYKVK